MHPEASEDTAILVVTVEATPEAVAIALERVRAGLPAGASIEVD